MKTANERVSEDIEALKKDIRRLRVDFAELPRRMRSWRTDMIMRSRERLRDGVTGLEDRARERMRNTSDALRERGHHAADRWRSGIERRPLTAIAIAFVAGLLFASLVERKCR